MDIVKLKSNITLLIFYIFLIIFLGVFVFLYSNYATKVYSENHVKRNQELFSNNISDIITNYRVLVDEDNNDGTITNGNLIYNGIEYPIRNEIAITKNNFFIINEDYFKVVLIEDVLNEAILNTDSNKTIIMDQEGLIYYGTESTNLNAYLDVNTTSYFNYFFSKNLNGVIKDSILN